MDVACINEEDHEYSVKLRNAKPVVEPQTELKLEALKKTELEKDAVGVKSEGENAKAEEGKKHEAGTAAV